MIREYLILAIKPTSPNMNSRQTCKRSMNIYHSYIYRENLHDTDHEGVLVLACLIPSLDSYESCQVTDYC